MKISPSITRYAHGKYRVYLYLGLYDTEAEALAIVDRMKTNIENGRMLEDIPLEKYSFKWYQQQDDIRRRKLL